MKYSTTASEPTGSAHGGRHLNRRTVLVGVTAGLAGGLAGCLDDPEFSDADVIVAPDNEYIFAPDEVTVSVGETVRWGFANSGHNLSCRPEDADAVVLPDGAEPFASFGADQDPGASLVPRGETYEHTFEVAGQYTYVCIPHVDNGMVGTIYVE